MYHNFQGLKNIPFLFPTFAVFDTLFNACAYIDCWKKKKRKPFYMLLAPASYPPLNIGPKCPPGCFDKDLQPWIANKDYICRNRSGGHVFMKDLNAKP